MASHGVARPVVPRTETQRLQDVEKIKAYRDLEDRARALAASRSYGLALFQLTSELLHLNPEYYTIWNLRRRCLLSLLGGQPADSKLPQENAPNATPAAGKSVTAHDPLTVGAIQDQAWDATVQELDCKALQSELAFTGPLLVKFPKSYCIWNFRQWILSQVILRLSTAIACNIWETELNLASKMLSKDRRNFHAWDYRRCVVARLESPELRGKSMVEDEFAFTTKAILADLSNFSAWHNRSRLILRLLDERGADDKMRAAFLNEELSSLKAALDVGPDDESLWFYHKFLMSQFHDYENPQSIVPAFSVEEKVAYLRSEISDIRDLLGDYDDIKWIYEAVLECTLALRRLAQCAEGPEGRLGGATAWLAKVRALDPMRAGRWNDFERGLTAT